jgi:AraC family transcriptional regulator
MSPRRAFLFHLQDINQRLNAGVSLATVAHRAKRSRLQFHRMFKRLAGETLKHYTLRMRLERAAARLVANNERILAVALANGFSSHEVFTRAFQRHFGALPRQYRARARAYSSEAQRRRHLEQRADAFACPITPPNKPRSYPCQS